MFKVPNPSINQQNDKGGRNFIHMLKCFFFSLWFINRGSCYDNSVCEM